jgi:hypothetical protein
MHAHLHAHAFARAHFTHTQFTCLSLHKQTGVPVVVAKRMLSGGRGSLVGRIVTNSTAAVDAAADGASLVLVTVRELWTLFFIVPQWMAGCS